MSHLEDAVSKTKDLPSLKWNTYAYFSAFWAYLKASRHPDTFPHAVFAWCVLPSMWGVRPVRWAAPHARVALPEKPQYGYFCLLAAREADF